MTRRHFSDPEKAREAGRRGGRAKAKRRLTLESVEKLLPPMDGVENIIARLEVVAVWAASGAIPGVTAHALTRGCEVALKALEAKLSREIVTELRQRLEELETATKHQAVRLQR